MKKVFSLIAGLALVLTLSACQGEEASVPTFEGLESMITLTKGDVFDPRAGITATDTIDGDITADIEITNTECLLLDENNVTTVAPLTCKLQYSVENSNGLAAMKIVTVTVEKGEPVAGENQIVNGDFEDEGQLAVWIKGEWDEGSANVTIEDGKLKVDVVNPSWNVAPRMHQEGLTYENGKTYVVTFDAYAEEAREISVQVGVLLSGAPWFITYADQQMIDLTTSVQTFTFQFTVTEDTTNNGILSFEFGDFAEGEAISAATVVWLDNVMVQEYTE